MIEKKDSYKVQTVYFSNYPPKHPDAWKKSRFNTSECCRLAVQRSIDLGIKQIVIASDTGFSALKLMEEVQNHQLKDVQIVVEAGMYGEIGPNRTGFLKQSITELELAGAKIVWATSAFSGLSRALRWRYGTIQLAEIIAATYKTFSEGVKVAVEIAMTCADTGDLRVGEKCVSIGGTSKGSDTAVVLTPCNTFAFFDGEWGMKIHEVICMPECRTPKSASALDYVTHNSKADFISYSP